MLFGRVARLDEIEITPAHQALRLTAATNVITVAFLWPPCVADADIIFLPCGFFFFFFLLLFSSPNLSGRGVDVYHTSTHGVA